MSAKENRLREQAAAQNSSNTSHFSDLAAQYQAALSEKTLIYAADLFGVSVELLRRLGMGWDNDFLTFPEYDAEGQVIGIARRPKHGKKHMVTGSHRGLTMAWPLDTYAGTSLNDPILVVEGQSDCAVGYELGFTCIGRPSAHGGLDHLCSVLRDRHVVIIGENDSGPGRDGAKKIADGLIDVCASVVLIFPPDEVKDLRQWHTVPAGCTRDKLLTTIARTEPYQKQDNGLICMPVLVCVADVKTQPIDWLWLNRIALGKLTLMAGDPGLGKSLVTLDIAARVSTGTGWPDAPGKHAESGGVVLLSAEDDIADTIRPRLDAAGADTSRIAVLKSVIHRDPESGKELEEPFCITSDLPALDTAIQRTANCKLVIVDPVTAYLGSTDSHKNAEIRGVLAPLTDLAERHGVAVIVITHLNKSPGAPAIYRAMGSLAFAAAARAVWGVTKDKDDPARRLFLPVKNNLAPDEQGLAYSIEPQDINGEPMVVWESDPVTVSADEAMAPLQDKPGPEAEEFEAAGSWLRAALGDGPRPTKEVEEEAREAYQISKRTLQRARKALHVKAFQPKKHGPWHLRLPAVEEQLGGVEDSEPTPKELGGLGGVSLIAHKQAFGGVPQTPLTPGRQDSQVIEDGGQDNEWGDVC